MGFWEFIAGSLSGADGKPSSKRITALWLVGLISVIVGTLLFFAYLAIFQQIEIKAGAMQLVELIATTVLLYLISSVLLLFGVQGWQQVANVKFGNKPKDKTEDETKTEG